MGKTSAHKFVHARALLLCDVGPHCGERCADTLGIFERTVERLKRRFVENGLEAVLGQQGAPLLTNFVLMVALKLA